MNQCADCGQQVIGLHICQAKQTAPMMLHDQHAGCVAMENTLREQVRKLDLQVRELQGHLERIAHFTLDREYYGPGESPAKACQTEAHEALKKMNVDCCSYTEKRKCICPNGTRTAIAHVSGCPLED